MYILKTNPLGLPIICKVVNNVVFSIPQDMRNQDYLDYLAWLAQGNTPEPPDPPPPPDDRPTLEERIVAAETLINLILDEEGI